MRTPKRTKLALGATLAVAALAISFNAFSELQVQVQPEASPIVAKEAGIFNAIQLDTVKSITIPAEGSYTCKDGKTTVEIGESVRLSLGSIGGSFLVTTNLGRKVIVFAPSDTAYKAALAVAIGSQLAGLPVTFRNNSSESQDAYFKGACDGVDKVSIANEITISK